MNRKFKQKLIKAIAVLSVLAINLLSFPVQAAGLSSVQDVLSRAQAGQASDHLITFTNTTVTAAGNRIDITFPSGFTMGSVAFDDIDLQEAGVDVPLQATTASGATWGVTVVGQVISLISGTDTIAAGAIVTIKIGLNATFGVAGNAQITNHGTPGAYIVSIGGTIPDSGQFALSLIANDQVPVTAVVNPTFTFTVVNTALALGTISTSSVATSGYNNITVATNGHSGYTIFAKSAGNGSNPGLYSAAAAKLIASATATLAGGTEGYGGNCNKVSGSGSCTFVSGASENVTGFPDDSTAPGVASSIFASYNAKPAGTETFQIRVKAAIATSTEAGNYTDTLTLVGSANF